MARCHVVMLTSIENQSSLYTGITNYNENCLLGTKKRTVNGTVTFGLGP